MKLYLLHSPPIQFVNNINIPYVFPTICFGLMGPSSGMFRFFVHSPLFRYSPHTGQCSHIGSVWYVLFVFALLSNVLFSGSINIKYYVIIGVRLSKTFFWSDIKITELLNYYIIPRVLVV
jgi:hypothetical protein